MSWVTDAVAGAKALGGSRNDAVLDALARHEPALLDRGQKAAMSAMGNMAIRRADRARLAWLEGSATFAERRAADAAETLGVNAARAQADADFDAFRSELWALGKDALVQALPFLLAAL